jgi:soluble lytic murein transglycosylase-like protein
MSFFPTALASAWKVGGEPYLPALNAAEIKFGIPTDLLARIAFQESSWRHNVIFGPANAENCIGLMQLNLRYFPNAGKDWQADILEAGQYLSQLYVRFNDWTLAVASYDWGPTNVEEYDEGKISALPAETANYVTKVFTDVPVPGVLEPPGENA